MFAYEKVTDPGYFWKVLENMMKNFTKDDPQEGVTVRFGETGKGVIPNYEIEYKNDEKITYFGGNHEKHSVLLYSEDRISPPCTLQQVVKLWHDTIAR